jgi:hypothetical protein
VTSGSSCWKALPYAAEPIRTETTCPTWGAEVGCLPFGYNPRVRTLGGLQFLFHQRAITSLRRTEITPFPVILTGVTERTSAIPVLQPQLKLSRPAGKRVQRNGERLHDGFLLFESGFGKIFSSGACDTPTSLMPYYRQLPRPSPLRSHCEQRHRHHELHRTAHVQPRCRSLARFKSAFRRATAAFNLPTLSTCAPPNATKTNTPAVALEDVVVPMAGW